MGSLKQPSTSFFSARTPGIFGESGISHSADAYRYPWALAAGLSLPDKVHRDGGHVRLIFPPTVH
jgi:hypothetical protein